MKIPAVMPRNMIIPIVCLAGYESLPLALRNTINKADNTITQRTKAPTPMNGLSSVGFALRRSDFRIPSARRAYMTDFTTKKSLEVKCIFL
mmetsp:Transcript_1365/g.973  ORF Transcript_1365/g.973 Transcript_1365/m.973 type:complete len:91 (+) Transcript_1365:56-328(+)